MQLMIQHPTDRPNYTIVRMDDLTLYVSYETIIAFHKPGIGTVVSENLWGPTTERHIAMAKLTGSPAQHLPRPLFDAMLSNMGITQ